MKISTGPIGKLDKLKPINIIGGGFSGLVLGYYLKKNSFQVKIFEKDKIGGKLDTQTTPYGIVETAANAIFTNNDVEEFISELNLTPVRAPKKLKKWVWKKHKPQSPINFFQILKIVPKLFKKIDQSNIEKVNMYDFFSPLLGEELAYNTISAAMGGVYAIDSKELHFKSVFKNEIKAKNYFQFFKELIQSKRQDKKGQSISFKNGLKEVIQKLESELAENIFFEDDIKIKSGENWVICTDAFDASLLFPKDSRISSLLSQLEYTSLSSTTLFSKKEIPFLKRSFGLVIPPEDLIKTKGILSNNEIFKGRSFKNNIYSYTFIGNHFKNQTQMAKEIKLFTQLDLDLDITKTYTSKWDRAIPKYNLKRYENILKLRSEFIKEDSLLLFGNYIDGISLRELVSQAKTFSQNLKEQK